MGPFPQHESSNFIGSARSGPNNYPNSVGSNTVGGVGNGTSSNGVFPGANTPHNMNYGNSFGGVPPNMPPPGAQHHHGNEGPQGIHPNSFNNNSIQQFGSRMASQNQGYHPYRRS